MTPEQYKKLTTKKVYKREEANLQRSFGQMIQGYERWGKLSPDLIKYSYIASGEARPSKIINGKRFSTVGNDLKKKGLKKGLADYFFCMNRSGMTCDLWLEAKSSTGKLTPEQIEFKNKINNN